MHLPEELWGPEPSPTDDARAREALQAQAQERLAEVVALSVSIEDAAARAGWSVQQIRDVVDAGELVTVPTLSGRLVPAWQLNDAAPGGILPGIARLSRAFTGNAAALTLWVLRPSPDLRGRTPRQALADGDADRVIDVARTLTAAGW